MNSIELCTSNVQIKDAFFKSDLYFTKIIKASGSVGQVQKICHLAAETCIKFYDSPQFNEKVYSRLEMLIRQSRNYFLLYLLDILIKNNKAIAKIAKNSIEELYKIVWDQVWQQYKNQNKLECLKMMARTWKIVYAGEKIHDSIQNWLQMNYGCNFTLEKKNEQLFAEVYQKFKPFQFILMPTRLQHEVSRSDSDKKSSIKVDLKQLNIQ